MGKFIHELLPLPHPYLIIIIFDYHNCLIDIHLFVFAIFTTKRKGVIPIDCRRFTSAMKWTNNQAPILQLAEDIVQQMEERGISTISDNNNDSDSDRNTSIIDNLSLTISLRKTVIEFSFDFEELASHLLFQLNQNLNERMKGFDSIRQDKRDNNDNNNNKNNKDNNNNNNNNNNKNRKNLLLKVGLYIEDGQSTQTLGRSVVCCNALANLFLFSRGKSIELEITHLIPPGSTSDNFLPPEYYIQLPPVNDIR